MKIRQILQSFKKLENKDCNEPESAEDIDSDEDCKEDTALSTQFTQPEKIIVAANKNIETNSYMVNNPVSFYCLNLPDIMNGNINLYNGGKDSIGIQNFDGKRADKKVFKHKPAFDDGKLEFATFDSLLYYILNKSNSLYQSGGPFQLDFVEEQDIRTFLNIDGEFYKIFNVRKIFIKKGDSL